jgi:lysozyme family protein
MSASQPAQPKLAGFLAFTLQEEGGYSDLSNDPGGATNLGVTQATLTDWREQHGLPAATVADVKALTVAAVTPIYGTMFDNPICGEQLPDGVGLLVFDFAVNAGTGRSARVLQQALGFTGDNLDGWVGAVTLAAAHAANQATLMHDLCAGRVAYYQTLSTFGEFGSDWVGRSNRCLTLALQMAGLAPPSVPATIELGASGAAVSALQTALKSAGIYHGTVDGDFGPRTKSAVMTYQNAHGLYPDCIAGPETLKSLGLA